MNTGYIFTFGCGQLHEGKYVEIFAATANDARETMNRVYGPKWSMMYASKGAAGVERWGLKCLQTIGGNG